MADSKKSSTSPPVALPFEQPIEDVRSRLDELRQLAEKTSQDLSEEIEFYRERLETLTREVYSDLSAWDRVQVARHPQRPVVSDFIAHACEDWVELHGDRQFGDDTAIVTGLATLGTHRVMLVGHRKGRDTKERMACNFGSAHPEGYRKALSKMRLAGHLGLPIVTLINTPGAFPGVGAEERGQARAIAENILEMFGIKVPIVSVVLGEGGSGGALGIAVADRVGMMENSWYSVISPEGCASILWHSAEGRDQAAEALKLTAEPLMKLGIVDEVIQEPSGGAHQAREEAMDHLRDILVGWLDEFEALPVERLLEDRHRKFRLIAASVSSLETAMDPGQTGHESEASLAPTDRAGEADLSAQPVFPKVPPESVD
ncbi:MAG: acetyl-CoA carboxylase carboxyltransferase subunit alpha [Planctomycetes bacterium]|nr:acetyl-CoA carboxylase carboxyltransferase subunit alpha [Planctomycetota bacterium]